MTSVFATFAAHSLPAGRQVVPSAFYKFFVGVMIVFVVGVGMGFGAAFPAKAETIVRPSIRLVQPQGSKNIYGVIDGKIHLIRSPSILQSYASRPIEKVSASFVSQKPRAHLIMSKTLGSRVYLLDEQTSQKLWFPTEESFVGSGENWGDIVNVSPDDSRAFRNGVLVRTIDDPTVYRLDLVAVERTPISSPEEFVSSGFSWADVLVAPRALLEGYALSGSSNDSDDNTTPATSGVFLEVTSPGTIKTTVIPSGTARNAIWDVRFLAKGGVAELNSLTLKRKGVVKDIDISNITITDDQDIVLANPGQLTEGNITIKFFKPLLIGAGEQQTLTIRASFVSTLSVSGGSVGFEITSGSNINTKANVQGKFPLQSPIHSLIAGNSLVGQLTVGTVEISSTSRSFMIGSTDQVLNKFSFKLTGANEDALIERIVFNIIGRAEGADFNHYEIVDSSQRVVASKAAINDRTITIDFGKTPYRLSRNQEKQLSLRADIIGGAYRTAQFIIENDYDIWAKGTQFGYTVIAIPSAIDKSFPIGHRRNSSFNSLTVEPGKVLLAVNAQSPTSAITRGASNVVLAVFDIRSQGQNLTWQKTDLSIIGAGPKTSLNGSIVLRVKGGQTIGSIDAININNESSSINFSNSPIIASGKTLTIEVVGNIDENATISDSYTVTLSNAKFVVTDTSSKIEFDALLTAPSRAVQEITLRVRFDPKFTTTTAIAGVRSVKLGRFLFKPSAGEQVRIDQVTIEPSGSSNVSFSDGFSNLRFGSKAISAPSGGPYQFALGSTINAGSEAGYDIYADTTMAVEDETVQFTVTDVIATGVTSKVKVPVQLEEVKTPVITFYRTKLNVSDNDSFSGGSVNRASATIIGSFTLTASGAEDVSISNYTIIEENDSSGLSSTRGYKNLRLVNVATNKTFSQTIASPVGGAGGNLLSGNVTLKPNQSFTFNVVVDSVGVTAADTIHISLLKVSAKGRTSSLAVVTSGLPATSASVLFGE